MCTRSLVIIFHSLLLITSVLYYNSLLELFVILQMTAAHSLNSHGIVLIIQSDALYIAEQVISNYPAWVYIIKTICVILCFCYFIMVLRMDLIYLLVCTIIIFRDGLMMNIFICVITTNVFYFCNFLETCNLLFCHFILLLFGAV